MKKLDTTQFRNVLCSLSHENAPAHNQTDEVAEQQILSTALDEMLGELYLLCSTEHCPAELTRTLRYAKCELSLLAQNYVEYGAEKKCALNF